MIEEATGFLVQRRYRIVIFRIKLEVEDVQVFSHTLFPHTFGNGYNAPLCQPAQNNLRHAFAVLRGYRMKNIIAEDVVFSFGERSPRFHLHSVFLKQLLRIDLLMEWMCFNLIDGRGNLL